jgi:lysophospholipase L1-like esterase
MVESGNNYYDFGKAFPINTKVRFPANAYQELNYLYNKPYSKAANNRFNVTTPAIVDRNSVQKVSFIASKVVGASDLSFYTLYIVDSTGTNSMINTQMSFNFEEYYDIEIPAGYDELFFYNGKNSSEAFTIDVKVIEAGTILAKTNIVTNNWSRNFGYTYKELRNAGTHNRISWYINLVAGKKYYLNVKKHYADAATYNIYYDDSTGTNARITENIGCFFDRLYPILLPQGYDRIFIYSGDYNDTSGYEIEYEVTDDNNYFSKVNENTEFSNRADGLRGKTIVCFGDSITEFKASSPGEDNKGYVEFLIEDFNCKAVRAGSGGARIAQRGAPLLEPTTKSEAYRAFDICNVVKAWCENDWTYIDPARYLLEHDASPDDCSFIDGLKAVSPADVDVVTIFGGTNDFTGNSVIGVSDSTDNGTVLGAINNIVSYLMEANPKMKVYFFTPIVRYFDNVRDEAHWSDNLVSTDSNMQGKKLPDLADIIAEQVKKKHIPCNNWYWNLGWNQQNFSTFFKDTDGTHPYKGFRWLANKIHAFVTSN